MLHANERTTPSHTDTADPLLSGQTGRPSASVVLLQRSCDHLWPQHSSPRSLVADNDMSEDHDLKQDLTTDVRLKSHQKRNNFIDRNGIHQNPRHFNGFPRRRHRDEGQPGPLIYNGQQIQRHGDSGPGLPLPNQQRGPFFDPVIREQRRLFYQSHYQNRNQQNGMRQSYSNYSHRNRSFRNRHVQSNQKNDAQCDNKKKDERPVRLENGSADPGSQTCLPEKTVTEGPVNHLDRTVRSRQQWSAGSRNASHPPPRPPDALQQHEKYSKQEHVSEKGKADRRHRSARRKQTKHKKQSPADEEAKNVIPEKIQEVEETAAEVDGEADEEETKCCPLCTEPLDPTECNLYPCCFCKFQICLFCLNRLKQEEISGSGGTESVPQSLSSVDQAESLKRVCGSCPGCRNPYPADSDDESMLIAVRTTKRQTKTAATERTGNRNRNTNWKHETRTTTVASNAEKSENRNPGNRSQPLLTQAKRCPPHDDHHKHQGKGTAEETVVNYQSEKATDCSHRSAVDRLQNSHSSPQTRHSRSVRVRGPGRRQQQQAIRDKAVSRDPDRAADQKQDAASIKQESKDELVSLLSSLGLSPVYGDRNIRFCPQRQES